MISVVFASIIFQIHVGFFLNKWIRLPSDLIKICWRKVYVFAKLSSYVEYSKIIIHSKLWEEHSKQDSTSIKAPIAADCAMCFKLPDFFEFLNIPDFNVTSKIPKST